MDSRFHELLYEGSGAWASFPLDLSALHRKIMKYRSASVSKHSRALLSLEEHRADRYVAAHDSEAAEKAALNHVVNARDSMAEMEI